MESAQSKIAELIKQALARYDAMTPKQKAEHDKAQRDSYVRSCVDWPKSNYKWINGVKVYDSYADYYND